LRTCGHLSHRSVAYLFKVQPGNAQILFSGNPIGASLFNPLREAA
jgi:hypothetical protein